MSEQRNLPTTKIPMEDQYQRGARELSFAEVQRIQQLSLQWRKGYPKSTFFFCDVLSHYFTILARRLYGQFLKRSFVGRELVTGKFDAKLVSHAHSRVINNENTHVSKKI